MKLRNLMEDRFLDQFKPDRVYGMLPFELRQPTPEEIDFLRKVDNLIVQKFYGVNQKSVSGYRAHRNQPATLLFYWKVFTRQPARPINPQDDWEDTFITDSPVLGIYVRFQPHLKDTWIEIDYSEHEHATSLEKYSSSWVSRDREGLPELLTKFETFLRDDPRANNEI